MKKREMWEIKWSSDVGNISEACWIIEGNRESIIVLNCNNQEGRAERQIVILSKCLRDEKLEWTVAKIISLVGKFEYMVWSSFCLTWNNAQKHFEKV